MYTDDALPLMLSRLLPDTSMTDGGVSTSALVELSESGRTPSQNFLRSFCRYCHSHPFYCGEMLRLCYAKARAVYL